MSHEQGSLDRADGPDPVPSPPRSAAPRGRDPHPDADAAAVPLTAAEFESMTLAAADRLHAAAPGVKSVAPRTARKPDAKK